MTERRLAGVAAAGGIAVGRALVFDDPPPTAEGTGGPEQRERAVIGLAKAAAELAFSARRLREQGFDDEAEILETSAEMAKDPGLAQSAAAAADTVSAESAVRIAAEGYAALLSELPDPLLAARAADVREIGRRAAAILGGRELRSADGPVVLVARELGPAELAELRLGAAEIVGVALAAGSVTSHAAIMARAFGVPMVVAVGDDLLGLANVELVVDGDAGAVVVSPVETTLEGTRAEVTRRALRRKELTQLRGLPSRTRDGVSVRLLCNACTVAEVDAGLEAGAEGVGLLRTELAFLHADGWPSEAQHVAALAAPLRRLHGRVATVRTFDFGADKTPPFLAGEPRRGLALALAYPEALATQLRAILRAAPGVELRVLLPLVEAPAQIRKVRVLLAEALEAVQWEGPPPAVGAMIETPAAARVAHDIAIEADFLSIGTNDLVQYTLELDRDLPVGSTRSAADPAVLSLIALVTAAAANAGLEVEVCGEAAGEPPLAALFVGLGVSELSVSPARIDELRAAIRSLDSVAATHAAHEALAARSADDAFDLGARLLSDDGGEERGEVFGGLDGVVA